MPIGIIQSDVPGTPIQKWMPNVTLSECYDGPRPGPSSDSTVDSQLYNAMIHPFVHGATFYWFLTVFQLFYDCLVTVLRLIWVDFDEQRNRLCRRSSGVSTLATCHRVIGSISDKNICVCVVADQGESNVGPRDHVNDTHGPENGADYYACALPAMVKEWRHRLAAPAAALVLGGTGVAGSKSSLLPFFIVELAAYCNEQDEQTFRTFCDANTSKLTVPGAIPLLFDRFATALRLTLVDFDAQISTSLRCGSGRPRYSTSRMRTSDRRWI